MNDDKLFQMIINIEKLHSKLNMDYNAEINRSVELGLIQKKMWFISNQYYGCFC